MEQTDQLILDMAHRLFSDHSGAEVVNQAENGTPPNKLSDAIMDAGLPLSWVPESAGGVGGSLELGFNLIRQAASFAIPVPLVETMAANLMLSESGLEVAETWAALVYDGKQLPEIHDGTITGTVGNASGVLTGSLLVVPVTDGKSVRIATLAFDDLAIEHSESIAGETRARVTMQRTVPTQLSPASANITEDGLKQFCALVRASQIAGAFEKITQLTVNYVKERQQFGRPLGKFQAIQHKVADIAGESALANAAVEQAIRRLSEQTQPFCGNDLVFMPVATAKAVTSEGAAVVSRLAHQCHGAMGFSFEYPLQQYTRRIWSWREEFGPEFYWSERIGMRAATNAANTGAEDKPVWDIVSH